MVKAEKISTLQMFAIMFIIRVTALFTFMLPSDSSLQSGDRAIIALPVMAFEFIYSLIVLFVIKKSERRGLIPLTSDISSHLGKVVAVIYALGFIWFAGTSVARFELFISTVMFPGSQLYFMAFLLIISAVYASKKGIEAIGRASGIILIILLLCIAFVLITVIDDFEYTNLKPPLTDGIAPVAGFAFLVSMRTVELLSLYITAPSVNGRLMRLTSLWILSFGILTVIIITVLAGVTGEYGDQQIFQLYTLTVIAKLGIFERLDDILSGIWVLCSFVLTAFLINTAVTCLEQAFGKINKVPAAPISGILILAVYLFTSRTVTVFAVTAGSAFQHILFIFLMLIIPLAVVIISRIKRKRRSIR